MPFSFHGSQKRRKLTAVHIRMTTTRKRRKTETWVKNKQNTRAPSKKTERKKKEKNKQTFSSVHFVSCLFVFVFCWKTI